MRIVVLYLLCLWSSLVCLSLEMEQPHRQKRQLDWNGGGKLFNYDHLALSSNSRPEHRSLPSLEEDYSSSADEDPAYVAGLSKSGLPGDPGIDYPILPSIPLTDFHCRGRTPGYYGDTQTACQVFHVCDISGRQDSFLCPNGTIFSQKLFACDWWYNVQCAATREHYQLNRNLFKGGDVNVYGTPSFWNWLSESEEEEVNPTAAPPTVAPKLRHHQQTAGARKNKYMARPSPSPVGPPFQLEQVTEPAAPQQSEIEQLPKPAPLVQSGPTEQFEEPVIDSVEVGPISPPPQLEPLGPPQWESFVPEIQQAPVVVEPAQPSMPIADDPDAALMSQGFTSEYRNHYFSWVNDAVHPGHHMAPELSWADLGPNGPLMTNPSSQLRSQLADGQQPTWEQQPAPVDRRRKAKPAAQHTQNPIAVKRQTSSRPATIDYLVPAPQPPVFHPKLAAPVKTQITTPPKHVTQQAPPKSPKSKLASSHSKTVPPPKVAPLPALKSKSNKTKPKQQRSPTVTTKTTTNAPLADQRYSIDDNDDVTNYDDNSDNKPTNQKIRDVIARQTSRFGNRIKKAKKALQPLPVIRNQQPATAHHQTEARQTQFVPSPKVMPIVPSPLVSISRADSSTAANSLNWIPKLNIPATPYRTDPFWNHPVPAQNRAITQSPVPNKPIASRPVVPSVRNAQRRSSTSETYHPAEVRTFEEFVQSSPTTSPPSAAVRKTRISSSFRPSMPIPAVTTNSHQPRVRALRAHPSSTRSRSGGKRKRKSNAASVYDPRLDRAYEQSHPIWKLSFMFDYGSLLFHLSRSNRWFLLTLSRACSKLPPQTTKFLSSLQRFLCFQRPVYELIQQTRFVFHHQGEVDGEVIKCAPWRVGVMGGNGSITIG